MVLTGILEREETREQKRKKWNMEESRGDQREKVRDRKEWLEKWRET